jgi:hypothetical protein
LINSLFVGPSSALIVYVLPVKSNLWSFLFIIF